MDPLSRYFSDLRTFGSTLENECQNLREKSQQHPSKRKKDYSCGDIIEYMKEMVIDSEDQLLPLRKTLLGDDSDSDGLSAERVSILQLDNVIDVCFSVFEENENMIDRLEHQLSQFGYQGEYDRRLIYDEIVSQYQNPSSQYHQNVKQSESNENEEQVNDSSDDSNENYNHHFDNEKGSDVNSNQNENSSSENPNYPLNENNEDTEMKQPPTESPSTPEFDISRAVHELPKTPTLDDFGISSQITGQFSSNNTIANQSSHWNPQQSQINSMDHHQNHLQQNVINQNQSYPHSSSMSVEQALHQQEQETDAFVQQSLDFGPTSMVSFTSTNLGQNVMQSSQSNHDFHPNYQQHYGHPSSQYFQSSQASAYQMPPSPQPTFNFDYTLNSPVPNMAPNKCESILRRHSQAPQYEEMNADQQYQEAEQQRKDQNHQNISVNNEYSTPQRSNRNVQNQYQHRNYHQHHNSAFTPNQKPNRPGSNLDLHSSFSSVSQFPSTPQNIREPSSQQVKCNGDQNHNNDGFQDNCSISTFDLNSDIGTMPESNNNMVSSSSSSFIEMNFITENEMNSIPNYLRSQLSLEFLNKSIERINKFCYDNTSNRLDDDFKTPFVTRDELMNSLEIGEKTKCLILVLNTLKRLQTRTRYSDGAVVYALSASQQQ